MTKKDDVENAEQQDGSTLSRRSFFKQTAAAGVGLAGLGAVAASAHDSAEPEWDYEVDIVVSGAGATGLAAAIRARDLGASVLVLEQNYDVGGKFVHSGGWVSLGGGDHIQERDRLGLDPDNLGLTAPILPAEDVTDDPDTLFRDITDWSVVDDTGDSTYRYNDAELHRTWADTAPKVRQFLTDNYVRFSRITGSNLGSGVTKARAPWGIMKLADVTDIEAGTVSLEDAGDGVEEKSSLFNPMYWPPAPSATGFGAPGYVFGGWAVARPMEYSARKKGVKFMMHRHMDSLIRDGDAGRVIGVAASYSPRFNPETGERLEGFWSNGNIDTDKPVVRVRARKGVIIGTGGYWGNVEFRTMFNPRTREPSFQYMTAIMGEKHMMPAGLLPV